jgi:hypothetical protein
MLCPCPLWIRTDYQCVCGSFKPRVHLVVLSSSSRSTTAHFCMRRRCSGTDDRPYGRRAGARDMAASLTLLDILLPKRFRSMNDCE